MTEEPARPQVRGGIGIINPKVGRPGTIGIIATRGGKRHLVSCYHVLCRLKRLPWVKGEAIYLADDPDPQVPVARVEQGLVDLDVAAAVIFENVEALGGILGFPRLAEPVAPAEGMRVAKMGHATGRTEGRIERVDGDDVWIRPTDGGGAAPISAAGDSGAVWVALDSLAPVVLHTGTNDAGMIAYARGVSLLRVLKALQLEPLPG